MRYFPPCIDDCLNPNPRHVRPQNQMHISDNQNKSIIFVLWTTWQEDYSPESLKLEFIHVIDGKWKYIDGSINIDHHGIYDITKLLYL